MGPELVAIAAGAVVTVWIWRHLKHHRDAKANEVPLSADLQVALHLGYHLAKVNQQRLVTPLALACALLQDEELAALFSRCGWDAEALQDALAARLEAEEAPKTRLQAGWALARDAEDALLRARYRGPREEAGCHHLLAELLVGEHEGEEVIAPILVAAQIAPAALLFALVHGVADAALQLPEGAPPELEVLLHNDDFTTMAFVVSVLREVFELEEEQAVALMLQVHQEGVGSSGRWIAERALELANTARERAREVGAPLRVSLR